MTRERRRQDKHRRHGDRFARTVEDEVVNGIDRSDYRHALSRYLLPHPDDSPAVAAMNVRLARAHELRMDEIEPGSPGTPPSWPHYEGQP